MGKKRNERREREGNDCRHEAEGQEISEKRWFVKVRLAHHLGRDWRHAEVCHDPDKLKESNDGGVPTKLFGTEIAGHEAEGDKASRMEMIFPPS